MDAQKLDEAIKTYKVLYEADPKQFLRDMEERNARSKLYKSYGPDAIRGFTVDDLVEYLGRLWAMRMWGNKYYKVMQVIEETGFEVLKQEIINLLYGNQPVERRWDQFIANVKGLGYAAASELLSYIDPTKYAIYNGTTNRAFEYFDISLVTRYSYQRTGRLYMEVCEVSKEILCKLKSANLPADDLLAVDYFFWDTLQEIDSFDFSKSETAEQRAVQQREENIPSSSLHNEIRDRLVDIGALLGFEARSEVRVGAGAKVDAVWEAQIGNMGKVMYVFEVQDKGSIDSLILNLEKANNNPAVQAIIAVSDAEQLEQIKRESTDASIENILKTWDSDSVLTTFEHLSSAHEAINGLGLVPDSF